MLKKLLITLFISYNFLSSAQTIITGEVYDEFLEPFSGAIIKTTNNEASTVSDIDGKFKISVKLPTTLIISYIDYSTEKITVTQENQLISCILKENTNLEQMILSASRLPERLFESPVSIERQSFNQIKKTPSITFYESLENLKNVDVRTNSILLKSVNTRGFSEINNNRFVQLIDGADNLYPIANLSLGNLIGLVDTDVKDVEVLTGASSALYGANAFNGVLLINSKNPFDYQGVSAKFQAGVTTQNAGVNTFYNPSVRAAYKFSDYFAAKVAFGIYSGEEWHAEDYRTKKTLSNTIDENSQLDRNGSSYYNGVNIYGDELPFNFKAFPFVLFLGRRAAGVPGALNSLGLVGFVPNIELTRNGYKEQDFIDNRANSRKFNIAFHFKPFGDDKLELSLSSRLNTIKSLFTVGDTKIQLDNAQVNQHTLTIKTKDFNILGYLNTSESGDSYFINPLGTILNNISAENNSLTWYFDFFSAFLDDVDRIVPPGNLNIARNYADQKYGVFIPGTKRFNQTVQALKTTPISQGGVLVNDNSRVYHLEGNFNLDRFVDFANILVGGSIRRTKLDSKGDIFTDYEVPINVREYGLYTQIRKNFSDNKLKTTFSLRYDKSTSFEATYSPRLTLGYALGENRNHNIRFAAQAAYRQPKNLDRYLASQSGINNFNLGNLQENSDRFNGTLLDVVQGKEISIDGNYVFEKPGFTADSFSKFYNKVIGTIAPDANINTIADIASENFYLLEPTILKKGLKPEHVNSFEIGYRGMINLSPTNVLELDINSYYNVFENFLYDKEIYIPNDDESDTFAPQDNPSLFEDDPFAIAIFNVIAQNFAAFNVPQNSTSQVNAYGVGVTISTKLLNKFDVSGNYTWSDYNIKNKEVGFAPLFNSPNHIIKLILGSDNLLRNVGFNFAGRWYGKHLFESEFANGFIDARTVVDGQISYKIPSIKSRFKLGGHNILGEPYYDNLGNGMVGSTYYLSWIIND